MIDEPADPGEAPAVLTATGLAKRFRSTLALNGVTVDLPAGSRTALVGPNGAGKSTLLRCWMGFERPTAGDVTVLGADPIRHRGAVSGSIAYLHQGASLYLDLSPSEHIELATTLRDGFDRALARDRLRRVNVPLGVACRALSGGQQAQVSIAIAVAAGGRVLLLDEPLASLDPIAREDFAAFILDEIRDGGRSMVISSHDITGLEQLCDRVLLLSEGRVVLAGSIAEVLRQHAIVEGDAVLPVDGVVGRVLDHDGVSVAVVRRVHIDGTPVRQPTLHQVLLAYLRATTRSAA